MTDDNFSPAYLVTGSLPTVHCLEVGQRGPHLGLVGGDEVLPCEGDLHTEFENIL